MNQTRCIVILSILALFVASVSVAGNISLPDASQKVFEGKPCINSPRAIGNYPASPFLFYIPTTGQRPMEWSAEKLPKGLKLDSKTGIITGSVASKGEYTVTLKAKNALGTSTEKLVIRIGDDLLLTPPMGWNSWNTFGRHLTEELVLQTADALVANGKLKANPMKGLVAAVSVGIVNGEALCDLEYVEDSAAETDMNVVMMEDGRMIEVQGTAEGEPFSHDELLALLALARGGIDTIFQAQKAALAD